MLKELTMNRGIKTLVAISALIVVLNFGSTNTALALGPGTTGASFLKIAPGARAVAMGEAFVAVSDDATALFWNPAGMVQIKRSQLALMHSFWLQGVAYDYLAYVQELSGPGNERFGLSISFLNSGEMERTQEDASGNYTGINGVFTATDLALGFAYAWEVANNHSLGTSFKFIRSTIDSAVGYGLSVDLGYLFRITPRFSIGANIQNGLVSMPIRFYSEKEPVSSNHTLPVNGKIGVAYRSMNDKLLLALDVNIPIDRQEASYHFGAEYEITEFAYLRGGYKTKLIQDIDILSGLCAGFGYIWGGVEVDYAFVPYGDLGITHRISLLMKF